MPSASLRHVLVLPLFALAACGSKTEAERDKSAGEPTAPSSQWVEPNPTERAVPVELPKTPMTNVPEASPAAK
jgi:hypothetical protein